MHKWKVARMEATATGTHKRVRILSRPVEKAALAWVYPKRVEKPSTGPVWA